MGALRPGLQVSPDLQLVRRLGKGGMGSVWVARHARLNAEVVIKFLADALLTDENIRARFAREVSAAAQVRSPHVVQTIDHGSTEDGTPYIVMELLDGEDLAAMLKKRGRLELHEAALVIESLASALKKAHDLGIVHRDIKPANVFLCSGGKSWHVKLVDFGIAKMADDNTLTQTGEMLGTPSYMSLEQFEGSRSLNHRTDIWSLGVLGYHMLTGKVPFRGGSLAQVAHAIMTNNATPPAVVCPDLPSGVDAWFSRACARKPDNRFASARELGDAFAAALQTKKHETATAVMPVKHSSSPSVPAPPPAAPNLVSGPHLPPVAPSGPTVLPSGPTALASSPSLPPSAEGFEATFRPAVGPTGPGLAGHRSFLVVIGLVVALLVVGIAVRVITQAPTTASVVAPAATATTAPPATVAAPVALPVAPTAEPAPPQTAIAATAPAPSASASAKRAGKRRGPGVNRGGLKGEDDDIGF